jgi:hypothetical protein
MQLNSSARVPAMSKMFEANYGSLATTKDFAAKQLMRLTLANLLWEDQFYINGNDSAQELALAVKKTDPKVVAEIAKTARSQFKLRHVPLFLMRELARKSAMNADDLTEVIQRPDEMGEFLSIYWKDGRKPLANQVKRGLGQAIGKFSEYQLAKWDKNSANISIRDVMFLTHPKPKDQKQAELFAKIANKQLETPDTWEVNLSSGANKKETFERLMVEKKLGALAFVRNLRNMVEAGVDEGLIADYGDTVNVERILPFRFVSAARMVPSMTHMLERMMFRCLEGMEKLPGKTLLMIDVSGSMVGTKVSRNSDLDRLDAAIALAMLCRELCEEIEIFTFSNVSVRVDATKRGFGLAEAIKNSQPHGGTRLGASLESVKGRVFGVQRTIVFTDEQSHDSVTGPLGKGYLVNVAAYNKGISESKWLNIAGFSEATLTYIQALEKV